MISEADVLYSSALYICTYSGALFGALRRATEIYCMHTYDQRGSLKSHTRALRKFTAHTVVEKRTDRKLR